MWLRASHITGFLCPPFSTSCYQHFLHSTVVQKLYLQHSLGLQHYHWHCSIYHIKSEILIQGPLTVSHTFYSYSILSLHFLSSSFPSAVLQFQLFPNACNTSLSFNVNLNCMLSPVFNTELDFLHQTDNSPKLFLRIYNLHIQPPTWSYTALLHSIKSKCIEN